MSKKLLILNPDHYMEVPFDQQLTIGRDVYNSLSLQDAEVSRSHAIIFDQGDKIFVKDLNSRNGVYVNGDKVKETELRDGDEVILGSTILFFNPPPRMEVEQCLSRRGQHLFKRRDPDDPSSKPEPITVFSREQMDEVVNDLLHNPDNTSFFTLKNAMGLLQAQLDMGRARHTADLFRVTLDRVMDVLEGSRGVIMESDPHKEKLKVRSIRSRQTETSAEVEIAQQVLRVVLRAERCVFCPNVQKDNRFSKIAEKSRKPVHSFVACPIATGKNYYGFIYLENEDDSHEYDYVDLRSLYFLASHLASLLQPRPTHFEREPELETSGSSPAISK